MPTFSPSLSSSFFFTFQASARSPFFLSSLYFPFPFQIILIHAKILFRDYTLCEPIPRIPSLYTPPSFFSLLSFLNVSFIYIRDTALVFFFSSFFPFFRLSYVPLYSPYMLYISMHPCIVVSLSSYLSIDSFFFFPSLVPCIQQSPRVLYSFTSPPIFRYSSRRSDHLCPSRISTLASTFFFPLSKSLILPLCIYIYILHILHPILVIFTGLA